MRRLTALIACSLGFAAVPAATQAAPLTINPPTAVAARVQWAHQQAQYFWRVRGSEILSSFHAGESAGQCTQLAAARRPDVIARVDEWTYAHYLLTNPQRPVYITVNWLAKAWAANARQAGLPTGKKPRRGAVMVFQPGAYGAGWGGHVAVVDHVNRNGSFTISEMHAPEIGIITTRKFGRRAARKIAKGRRVTFIYK